MPHVSPSDPPNRGTPQTRPGAPPPGQVMDWLRFALANLSQIRGFGPKMKALGHIISVLVKR